MKPSKNITSLFMLYVFASCNKQTKTAPVPEVNVVTVGQRDVPVYVTYIGQTLGKTDIEIRPRAEGWIKTIHFKEGATVKKGQLLYVIQDDELKDRERAAYAQYSEANVLLVKARSDLSRVKPLAEMNALSQRDLDAAQASYDAQRQAVVAAKAQLDHARTQLGYSRITAPVSGTIGISKVQVGDYVKSGASAPINTISATSEMRVRFAITENDYLEFRKTANKNSLGNLDVAFILNDGSVFPENGKIDFANREIDPSTGSLMIQAVVANKSNLLRPGQYVKVRIRSNEIPGAVLVPQQAINQMQNIYMAYVVNDSNKIEPQPVKTGMRIGSNWVITEGLKPGEKVALIGNAIIKPGMHIKPVLHTYSYDSTSIKQ